MNHKQLAQEIFKIAHLTGVFKLRSGKISNEYFDKYRFESDPKLLKAISDQMAPLVPKNIDGLAALEMGGIPVATALSLKTGLPVVFVRKKAKDYGTCLFAEGMDIKGKTFCIVEDVITTGGQVALSAQDLRSAGAIVKDVICVINRGDTPNEVLQKSDLSLHALFTRADF